jgi:hypothetical protein
MSTETEPAKTRTRSPAYPVIALGQALDLARKLWDSQRKHESHIDAAIKAMGYARHGASLRIIAALGHYGLTEESGAADQRKIRLSDLAQDILHLQESDPKRREALKSAALAPAIHAALWERYGAHLPDDNSIRPFLIRDKGFNDAIVQDVLDNYRSTFELANLGKIEEDNANEKQVDPDKPQQGEAEGRTDNTNQQRQTPFVPMNPAVQELPILVGPNLVARIPFPMTEDDFDLMMGTLNLWKKKIVRSEFPKNAVWKNKDHDMPVTITGKMGEKDGEVYYQSSTGTGIPGSELEFQS